ncbi:uncharacterized protein LOC128739330 [Sabethes cyaneus]|uniref:uncharacterized protein LOC128739330 n=1 Tax=Sabethes cyaneus TaxID=53552 RepID=UPI00237E29F4|nr:uncharacterized protein LOC128739330 [Sabethes cyaneus]
MALGGASKMNTLREYVKVGLKKVATDNGFSEGKYRIAFENWSNRGDGFMGNMFPALIRQDGVEDLKVLVKDMPKTVPRRKHAIGMFEREALMFNNVLPAWKTFQAERGLFEKAGFWHAPECYYAHCDPDKLEGVIIMEDLRETNFRMLNKLQAVNEDHVRLLMEKLGKMHALSFAMRDQAPEQFETFKKLIDPSKVLIAKDKNRSTEKIFAEMFDRAIQCLDSQADADVIKRMKKLEGKLIEQYLECVDASKVDPYAAVTHGDCSGTNVMYSYIGNDPKPTNIRLIDWQLSRYVSPVLDLSQFMFISTNAELRGVKYEPLIRAHYQSLCAYLKRLGSNPERLYPADIYQGQWNKYGRFGMIMGLIQVPMMCTSPEDLPDMDEFIEKADAGDADVSFQFAAKGESLKLYQSRIRGMLRDAARFGYLND